MIGRLRTGTRLARVGIHLGAGLLTVAAVYPLAGPALRQRLKRRWSRQLLARLGVDLEVNGHAEGAALVVANHVSWLDIFVINAVTPAAFVCKDEVRAWPLIGWLCARTETIFIARGKSRDARQVGSGMARILCAGGNVAVFPEGTTSDGGGLLPFRTALLQPAVDVAMPVRPTLIRYRTPAGTLSPAPVYVGETSLFESMRRIAAAPRTIATCTLLPNIDAAGVDRRRLAGQVENTLRDALRRAATALPDKPGAALTEADFQAAAEPA